MTDIVQTKKSVPIAKYIQLALSHAIYSQNEDGSWTVEMPQLPGCVTWGKDREEAVGMAVDAIEGWVLTALRFGDQIPEIDNCVLRYAHDFPVQQAA